MRPRLLLATTEVPATGGSGTAGYDLFRRLLEDGHDVHHVNLLGPLDPAHDTIAAAEVAGNPRALPNVRHCRAPESLSEPQPELTRLLAELDPQVVVGLGFLAATRLKRADPARPTVLLTGTCRQAQDHVTLGFARDAVSLAQGLDTGSLTPRVVNGAERIAFTICDLVITHSALTLEMIRRFFPALAGKVYPRPIAYAEWIADGAATWRRLARPFDDRDVDVLVIASNWARPEKNYSLLTTIAQRLGGLCVHVVGHVPRSEPGATHHGFVGTREALFALVGRARVVVCPSSIDAAPGVLYEAAALGCNVVASKNCGNWDLCHPDLLAEPYGPDAFVACIRRAVTRRYPDQLERILQRHAYRELVALLTAFAHPFRSEALA